MPTTRIEAANAVPWSDVEHALTGGGDGATCWCQWFLVTRKEFSAHSRDEQRAMLRQELADAQTSPGLIAYADDSPAAWVRVGPRTSQPALARSRIVKGSAEPIGDDDVWAITCFVVRREHRREGLATELTAAAAIMRRSTAPESSRHTRSTPISGTSATTSCSSARCGCSAMQASTRWPGRQAPEW